MSINNNNLLQALQILQLPAHELPSTRAIKKAYRKLSITHHPDKGGSAEAFHQLKAAYDFVLPYGVEEATPVVEEPPTPVYEQPPQPAPVYEQPPPPPVPENWADYYQQEEEPQFNERGGYEYDDDIFEEYVDSDDEYEDEYVYTQERYETPPPPQATPTPVTPQSSPQQQQQQTNSFGFGQAYAMPTANAFAARQRREQAHMQQRYTQQQGHNACNAMHQKYWGNNGHRVQKKKAHFRRPTQKAVKVGHGGIKKKKPKVVKQQVKLPPQQHNLPAWVQEAAKHAQQQVPQQPQWQQQQAWQCPQPPKANPSPNPFQQQPQPYYQPY